MATVADLLPQILARLEEPDPNVPVFWTRDEASFAALEALNDLLLLVGRPTQIASVPFLVQPHSVWQQLPPGMFAITDIQGAASQVYKVTLQDFDYLQAYGRADWEQDVGEQILQWCPLGLTRFAVHPAVAQVQTVLLTGIAYPTTQIWPYDPTTIAVPFADEFLVSFEKYASHVLRFKEGGDEFTTSYKIYQSYLADAQRLTQLEDRRDPWLFHLGTGVQTVANPIARR